MSNDVYKRPPRKARNTARELTVQQARTVLGTHTPCYTAGNTTLRATFVREEMTTSNTLSFIWRNPFTGAEHRFVVDFKTGVQRDLGPIRRALPQRVALPPAPKPKLAAPKIPLLPWLRF